MKIPVHGTKFPRELKITAGIVLGDPSKWIKPSIELNISWLRNDDSEWGVKYAIDFEQGE